jgi:hypothetical protein
VTKLTIVTVLTVLTIQGLETYILLPRDPGDLDLLIEAIRPRPSPEDQDAVIGLRRGVVDVRTSPLSGPRKIG